MSEDTRVGAPAPGWLYDAETDQTRWWNGVQFTDHAKPLDPIVRTSAEYRLPTSAVADAGAPLSTKNGAAKAALVLLLLSLLGIVALMWLVTGLDPALASLFGVVQIALLVGAFLLSIVGLVTAVRRPTRKREAVFGLVMSTLLLGFLAFRIATAPGMIDAAALEGEIAAWAVGQSGEVSEVTCPDTLPQATGAVFTCSVVGASGAEWDVAVTVGDGSITWEPAP